MKKDLFPHLNYGDLHHQYLKIRDAYPDFFNLQKSDILTDQDLCEYLKISVKTLRKFCREEKIHHVRLGSRYYYLPPLFTLDLMKISNDS